VLYKCTYLLKIRDDEDDDGGGGSCCYLFECVVSECWDCVSTVFFIDTAHNIVSYIETIWKILKPNGYWINLGWYYRAIECLIKCCCALLTPGSQHGV